MLNNKVYDFLKWFCLLFLPALAWFVGVVAPIWGVGNVDAIVRTINATATFLGVLIGVSTLKYNGGAE